MNAVSVCLSGGRGVGGGGEVERGQWAPRGPPGVRVTLEGNKSSG